MLLLIFYINFFITIIISGIVDYNLKASAIDNIWSPVTKYLKKNLDIQICKNDITIKHLQNNIMLYVFVSFFYLTEHNKITKYLRVMISRCSGLKARLLTLVNKGFVICSRRSKVSLLILTHRKNISISLNFNSGQRCSKSPYIGRATLIGLTHHLRFNHLFLRFFSCNNANKYNCKKDKMRKSSSISFISIATVILFVSNYVKKFN